MPYKSVFLRDSYCNLFTEIPTLCLISIDVGMFGNYQVTISWGLFLSTWLFFFEEINFALVLICNESLNNKGVETLGSCLGTVGI